MPPERRPRVVLDTNVLVSGFIGRRPQSAAFRMIAHFSEGTFQLLASAAIISEYQEVLSRPWILARQRVPDYSAREILDLIIATAELIEPSSSTFAGLRDTADAPLISTAIEGRADYLVSGDKHLLDLTDDHRLYPVRIVKTRDFADLLDRAP